MRILEFHALLLDLLGLALISWYLFSTPDPVRFTPKQDLGVLTSFKPVADAINEINRNVSLIYRIRIGFFLLTGSLFLKVVIWVYRG